MFRGFSPETMDFLWGIRMNNERSWFLAHKNEGLGGGDFSALSGGSGLGAEGFPNLPGRENAPGHTVQGKSVDLHPPPGGYVEPASGPLF